MSSKDTMRQKWAAVGVTLAMAPVNAYVGAWTMSRLWQWFISTQYGAGPSMAVWFGIGAIANIALGQRLAIVAKDPEWDRSSGFISRAVMFPIACALMLASCGLLGSIMGWMA